MRIPRGVHMLRHVGSIWGSPGDSMRDPPGDPFGESFGDPLGDPQRIPQGIPWVISPWGDPLCPWGRGSLWEGGKGEVGVGGEDPLGDVVRRS